MEKTPEEIDRERYQREMEQYKALVHASTLASFDGTMQFSRLTIRTLLTVNGGASVAMLAFIGQIARDHANKIPDLALPMLPFVFGVLFAAITAGTAYLSQAAFTGDWDKTAWTINAIAILSGIVSIACFGIGGLLTYCTITHVNWAT